MWTFWARIDSNSANNPALNLTGDPAVQFSLVESGPNGDLTLDTNGGAPDPDTQVDIGGTLYDFSFELSAELPTLNRDGAGQVPDQFEGSSIFIITVQDYPSAGDTTRLAFMPDEAATQTEMDAFGNGAIDLQATGTEPAPDYIVEGTSGADVIDASYGGDLEGDLIDNNDGNPLQPGTAGGDNDSVTAGAGNDYVASGAGDDTVLGEDGDDTLDGGVGADSLVGGAGNDSILVGQNDTAIGGAGDDTFTLVDLMEADSGSITIDGLATGETGGDTLDLGGVADRTTLNVTSNVDGEQSGTIQMFDGTLVSFSNIDNIICFTPGTAILTEQGYRPIETLKAGERVITRDNGPRPIRWIGTSTVNGRGRFAPIAVNTKVMDGARRPLLVSPQHRILFTGYKAQLLFGESEVVVAAKYLVDGRDVRVVEQDRVTYVHLMLDQHEVIFAEEAATESFFAGETGIAAITDESREEMFSIFPELRWNAGAYGMTARTCLRKHEARMLLAQN
ncbi:Hint domain-containing protein [Aestuariicoccus sp. MJ-SS9]|uniref:Hint domain-containing protein n=1 Tax=Aestuariicoccus sp. MJ-SS9 TaxID=3079855 RepID=UPI00290F71E7|nr:Hint domain-containing protein [Aestuariicoccus sp. MJ-SS9]MDU8912956.1 Hint domain-containing protein [Aestuariicoccus sp. MJ-SS9]